MKDEPRQPPGVAKNMNDLIFSFAGQGSSQFLFHRSRLLQCAKKSRTSVLYCMCSSPLYFLVVVPKSLEQRNLYQIQADNSSSNKFICSSSVSLSHNSILAHSLLSICCRFAVPYLTIIVLLHNSLSRWVKCFHQTQQQTLIERGFEPATHQLQDKLLPPSPLVNNNFHF